MGFVRRNMYEMCEVLGCGNARQIQWHDVFDPQPQSDEIAFFEFPSDEPLRTGWIRFTGRTVLLYPDRPLMCSVHFRQRCFSIQNANEGQPVLLHGSMPTLWPPLTQFQILIAGAEYSPAVPTSCSPSMFLPARNKYEDPRKMLEMVVSFSRPAVPPLAFVPAKQPFESPRKTIEAIENSVFDF